MYLLLGNSSCMWTMHCRESGCAARAGAGLPVRLLCCGVFCSAGAGRPCSSNCAGGARCAWPTAAGGLQCPGAEPLGIVKSLNCRVCACSGVSPLSMAHDHSAEYKPRPCEPCTLLKTVRTASSGPCMGCCNLIGARPDPGYHDLPVPFAGGGRSGTVRHGRDGQVSICIRRRRGRGRQRCTARAHSGESSFVLAAIMR